MTRVAFVQDHLVQRGGAERVLLSMATAFPQAPIHTAYWWRDACYPEFEQLDVQPLPVNRVRVLREHHRATLPLMPLAFSALKVDADVTVCGSSGWAAGCRVSGRKIVYHHSLARWLHETDAYLASQGGLARLGLTLLQRPLRRWDRAAVASGDAHYAYSAAMQHALQEVYGIDVGVLPPPVVVDPTGPVRAVAGIGPGYWLCACRLLPYKNVDTVVEAFRRLPDEQLVVAGDGPERQALEAAAPANVTILGAAETDEMRWLYANSVGVVSAAYEPFGLTPLEAAAFGRPAAVLRAGGFRDTVVDGHTGVFFDGLEADAIVEAIRAARSTTFDPAALRTHAAQWSEASFVARLRAIVAEHAS